MRTAAVMLAQLYQHQNTQQQGKKVNAQAQTLFNDIRTKLIQEMMDLETVRVAGLEANVGDLSERGSISNAGSPGHFTEDIGPAKPPNKDTDDPSAAVFREPWSVKKERIRQASPYGHNVNWNLLSVIVKSGADLRQEQIALQLIYEMDRIWKEDAVPVRIYK
jgi:phosphatidylinositol 4-kinase